MQAIVTGASRGLGLALTRALAARGWRVVVDARDGERARARGRQASTASSRSPATSPTPSTGGGSSQAAGEPIDLLVNNASVLGPSPQPALADYPLEELRRVYEINVVAPLALVQLALPHLAEGARIVNVTSDAAVEAVRGLGRLRLVEGGARAAQRRARRRASRASASTPSTRATCARSCSQEAFPGEDISDRPPPEESVPGLLALDRGRAPERALPGARPRGGLGMSEPALRAPARLEAHEPPEARGLARDAVRLLVSDRSDGSIVHARFRDLPRFLSPGDLLVVNTSATLPAAVAATRDDGTALELRLSTPGPGRDSGPLGRRAASRRRAVRRRRGRRAADASRRRRGAAPRSLHRPAGSGSRASSCPLPLERYLAEHGRPIRYGYVPAAGRSSAYQNVYALEPGSAEMASAGRPSRRS